MVGCVTIRRGALGICFSFGCIRRDNGSVCMKRDTRYIRSEGEGFESKGLGLGVGGVGFKSEHVWFHADGTCIRFGSLIRHHGILWFYIVGISLGYRP